MLLELILDISKSKPSQEAVGKKKMTDDKSFMFNINYA